jgi:beta-lactamase superfamily II metal-dependent hydrolase
MNIQWPKHKASLHLTHNDHLGNYQTVAEAIKYDNCGYDEWVSEEQKQKAIDTNDCWTLHWYPDTPIGFYVLSAADLDILLEAANKIE